MTVVKVQYAKTHLSALLARVEKGEQITIARGSHPIATLVPFVPQQEREMGFVKYEVPDSFSDPLPEEELARWEGSA